MNYDLTIEKYPDEVELVLHYKYGERVIWRSIDTIKYLGYKKLHDQDGFIWMEHYTGEWSCPVGDFYIANEKEIKEKARVLIVKEML